MERDPKIDPRPGDILAGPMMRLRVEWVKTGIGGALMEIGCSFSFDNPDRFQGSRKFSHLGFMAFVGSDKTTVLQVADSTERLGKAGE